MERWETQQSSITTNHVICPTKAFVGPGLAYFLTTRFLGPNCMGPSLGHELFFCLHSRCIPGAVRILGAFWVHSGCIPGAFVVHCGCTPGAFWVHLGRLPCCILGAFRAPSMLYSGCSLGTFQVHSGIQTYPFAVV